jgi:hypothetical protein
MYVVISLDVGDGVGLNLGHQCGSLAVTTSYPRNVSSSIEMLTRGGLDMPHWVVRLLPYHTHLRPSLVHSGHPVE